MIKLNKQKKYQQKIKLLKERGLWLYRGKVMMILY